VSINSRKLDDGRVVYDVRLRDPLGRQYKRTFRTKREAESFMVQERAEQDRGTWVDPRQGRVTLADYSKTWLGTRVHLRIRTRELYEGLLRRQILPALGSQAIGELTSGGIRAWYAGMSEFGLAQSTAAKAYRLLRTIMTTAVEDGLVAKNPCTIKGAGVARSPERPVASVQQVMALADAIEPQYRIAVLLGTYAGLRLGELLALTRERLDLEARTVVVVEQLQELAGGGYFLGPPKSEAGRRVVALPQFMTADLEWHLERFVEPEPTSLLFRGARGGPLRRAVLYRAWDEARAGAGVPHLHFHDLRHTGNTLAASTGASTRELMARMGHASAEAALRYQHATRERDVTIASGLNAMVEEAVQRASECAMDEVIVANVTSLESHRAARQQRHERRMAQECAMDAP